MHQRPSGTSLSEALRTALGQGKHRAQRIPRVLVAAVVVLVAAGLALFLPSTSRSSGDDGALALAADRSAGADQRVSPRSGSRSPSTAADSSAPATTDAGNGKASASATASATAAPQGWGRDRPGHRGDHQRQRTQQPQPPVVNANCTLTVPAEPTSAAGLATPYRLTATDRRAGACHETNPDQSAFVEAAIVDPATGAVSVYHPLVVDTGTEPAAAPVPVSLPAGAVVGIWFGFNGDTLTLDGPGARACVNGLPGSPFGQFAYCNAQGFFSAAHAAISAGKLAVPPLGTGQDGLPCPTVRDFSVVDQDQSDNLATVYRVIRGRMAQDTAATRTATKLTNGSDNGLLVRSIDPALGCAPFQAPDLTDGGAMTPALALNELSAAVHQAAPSALVPTIDPMAQVDGAPSPRKTNLFRAGVDQPPLPEGQDDRAYCANILGVGQERLTRDAPLFRAAPAPSPDAANLQEFLTTRLKTTLVNLQCRAVTR